VKSADLLELHDDLGRECTRLQQLVDGLNEHGQQLDHSAESVEAAELQLHKFLNGHERMLLLVSRVVSGGHQSQGEEWHCRLLKSLEMNTDTRPAVQNGATQVGLQEFLQFRHLMRNLYVDKLRVEPIQRLIEQLQQPGQR